MYNEKTIENLRQKVLDLAIRGKLVPQDPNDEPASVLIEKIRKEREKLIKEGKIKKPKEDSFIFKGSDNLYYENEYKLGEILQYEQPSQYIVKSTDYSNEYDIPVLTPGKTFILGYTNEKDGIYKADKNNKAIIFDDFTTASRLVDFNFKVKSSAVKILHISDKTKFDIDYMYYLLQTINIIVDTHKRFWISEYMPLYIKIPPLWYQELAVAYINILNNNLKYLTFKYNEIERIKEDLKRKILDSIFSPDSSYKSYYENKIGLLKDFCDTITKGTTPTTYGFEFKKQGIPFIKVENVDKLSIKKDSIYCYIDEKTHEFLKRSQLKENDILFSIAGTIGKLCLLTKNDVPANTNQAFAIISGYTNNMLPKYLLYYLYWITNSNMKIDSHGGGMNNATIGGLKELSIWFPNDKNAQKQTVEKIDKIFSLIDSM